MIIEGLALYGVERTDGKIYALLAHGTTTLMLIVLGLIGLIALPLVNEFKEDNPEIAEKSSIL
jgi:hypothetical protein